MFDMDPRWTTLTSFDVNLLYRERILLGNNFVLAIDYALLDAFLALLHTLNAHGTILSYPSINTPILNYTRPLRMHDRICVALVGHWQSLYSHCQGKTKSWIDRAKQLLVRKQRFIDHYCHLEQKRWQHQASCYIKNNLLVQPVGLWNHSISGGTTTEIKLRYCK